MGKRMSPESIEALNALAADKGMALETLLAALADAIETGYKSQPGSLEHAWVTIDPAQMEIKVISQELSEDGEPIGDEVDITPENFGRIATQATRQVLTQGIREVEWEQKYEEYAGREGEVVTGIVKQSDARFTLLDLGNVEALLPPAEQVPYERLENGTRLKAYIVEVRYTTKGPQVVVSRTHPGLIKRLFEMEVPEIADGIVEMLACSREPGHRTKIAVYSHDENVDPVGACVGARGIRVRPIVNELMGEKIDIVPYDNNPNEFVGSALSPAKVREVRIDEETNVAEVIVPEQQLSLAIGREGQNARLAARLTGYTIEVRDDGEGDGEEVQDASTDSETKTDSESTEWEGGEWIADPETGEQVFHPADGSDPINAEEWEKLTKSKDKASPKEETSSTDPETASDPEKGSDSEASADSETAAETAPEKGSDPETTAETTADSETAAEAGADPEADTEAVEETTADPEIEADTTEVATDQESDPKVVEEETETTQTAEETPEEASSKETSTPETPPTQTEHVTPKTTDQAS